MNENFFQNYIRRLQRIGRHIVYPIWKHPLHLKSNTAYVYIGDFIYYLLDLTCLPELFIIFNRVMKLNIRSLTDAEKIIAQNFYGEKLDVNGILIDAKSRFLTKKYSFAYVSMNLINYWENISDYVLIHELVHVHQYRKFGIVYIFRALLAQNSKEVYNYGGYQGLIKAMNNNISYYDFNFEQQASIIEHYFLIQNREDLRENEVLLNTYRHFFNQL